MKTAGLKCEKCGKNDIIWIEKMIIAKTGEKYTGYICDNCGKKNEQT